MNCEAYDTQLDDYLDARLGADDAAAFDRHVAACARCREQLGHARRTLDAVRDFGRRDVPLPDRAWFELAVRKAAWQGARRQRRRWWITGFSSAAAAGLAVWLLAAQLAGPGDLPVPEAGIPAVAMTLEEPRTVRLVFTSATALSDATLTVQLPEGIELEGFAGQREITWMTSLSAGRNVLPLRLIAVSPQGGELLATLRHGEDGKTFRLRVDINEDASISPGPISEQPV